MKVARLQTLTINDMKSADWVILLQGAFIRYFDYVHHK